MGIARREFLKGSAVTAAGIALGLDGCKLLQEDPRIAGYDALMKQISPAIREYSEGVGALVGDIYGQQKNRPVPPFVHKRVRQIFSEVLGMPEAQAWNERLYGKGIRAHYAAYMLQDFRNSQAAGKLSEFHRSLSPEGRRILESRLSGIVKDPLVFGLMFKSGLRPLVFHPNLEENSDTRQFSTEAYPDCKEVRCVVRDNQGRLTYDGVDESPTRTREANYSHTYDESRQAWVNINYYINAMPNLYFWGCKPGTVERLNDISYPEGEVQTAEELKVYYKDVKGSGDNKNILWVKKTYPERVGKDGVKIIKAAYFDRFEFSDAEREKLRGFFRWKRQE
jgi:hypothetical protein